MIKTLRTALGGLVLLAAASAAQAQSCVDHAATPIGLTELRVRDASVVEASAERRVERGAFPDGTILTATNESCDGKTLTVAADLASDPQTAMRLTQIAGQIDRLTRCAPLDYAIADATQAAAASAIDSGAAMESAVFADHDQCAISLAVEPGEAGRMIAVYTILTKS